MDARHEANILPVLLRKMELYVFRDVHFHVVERGGIRRRTVEQRLQPKRQTHRRQWTRRLLIARLLRRKEFVANGLPCPAMLFFRFVHRLFFPAVLSPPYYLYESTNTSF